MFEGRRKVERTGLFTETSGRIAMSLPVYIYIYIHVYIYIYTLSSEKTITCDRGG
jgi:hypothetical protein